MTATILDMTRDWVDANCERLKALSADLAWDYWDRQHFLRELPGKWTLSRRAEIAGELAGYAIASQKGNWLWLHHLVVAAAHRSSGLGARLLEALETAPCAAEVKGVRLKVGCDNERALAFYLRRGYRQVGVGDAYLGLEKLFPGRAKIVAIHQPNYFPWPGYFNKMLGCDDFVFLDDALTSNNSFINRNRIKQHGAELWLTVPCRQHLSDPINQVGYADNKWPSKHLKTIQQYYSKAPYFNDYFPTLRDILQSPPPKLAALNIKLIQQVADWLDIRCAVHLSSALGAAGSSDERLVDLVQRLHGDVYLSGKGGANYQSEDTFRQRNIRLVYHSFRPPTYPQLGGAFIPGLSILDLLFNCGPAARSFLAASDDAAKAAA
jgi:GNAT superfamily N-acetyltransferase